ncbi:hypothetical protein TEA_012950 [Camellia sinensis var. sinensis]|uniref:Peptidase S59 domain-containing protein n=1 Tax=Camellia sinensis var. sinensis TaxID=542762 RepID=A0A4S4DQX0_CAMSN|nr:hypothetical protein TEA_012950 [Camellia sinensis var. sinensis]
MAASSVVCTWLVAACMSVTCEKDQQQQPVMMMMNQSSSKRFSRWARKRRVLSKCRAGCSEIPKGRLISSGIQGLMSSHLPFEPCDEYYSSKGLCSSDFFGDNGFSSLFGSTNVPLSRRQRRFNRAVHSDASGNDTNSGSGILFEDKICVKRWHCPRGSTVVDYIAPVFRLILEENYLSSSMQPLEDTKKNRDLEDSWFGPIVQFLLLGEWSGCEHQESQKKLMHNLKVKRKVDAHESLIKVIIGGAKHICEREESILQLILNKGCFIDEVGYCNQQRWGTYADTSDGVESLSKKALKLILEAAREVEEEECLNREPVILVLDFDVQTESFFFYVIFVGSSAFRQKLVFGGFASNPNQSNSFWNSLPQNQTTFQSSPFGSSTSFGASTQNSFGSAHSLAFSAPISSHNCVAAFGFGTGGASRSPTFGTSSTTGFGFGTTPTFGQSTSASGSSNFFGTTLSSFGDQNSFLGAQSTTPTFGTTGFGQSAFCSQHGGSRAAAYTATAEVHDGNSAAKLESISAMTINKDKSHEELRWEDYLFGDKGGPHCMGQSAGGIGGSTVQSRSFDPSPTLATNHLTIHSIPQPLQIQLPPKPLLLHLPPNPQCQLLKPQALDIWSATQSSVALQPAPNVSPFGALPAMPPLSIGHPGSIPSIQYGISSMPLGYGSTTVELLTRSSCDYWTRFWAVSGLNWCPEVSAGMLRLLSKSAMLIDLS